MRKTNRTKLLLLLAITAVLLSTALTACSGSSAKADIKMHPVSKLPENVRDAPVNVRQAYQFAIANPDLIQAVPCYCGCGPAGHDSNYDCYVSNVKADGDILYDYHAMGCTICVDITLDVMRLTAEGEAIEDIRTTIDRTYSQFGPSNMAPVE